MTSDEARSLRPGHKVQVNNTLVGPGRVFTIGDLVVYGGWVNLTDDDFTFIMEVSPAEVRRINA